MTAVRGIHQFMSLNKSLQLAGVSKQKWYYTTRNRTIPVDRVISDIVQKIGQRRPTYGTRRMAHQVTRQIGTSVNRKKIQRIYRNLGWIEPRKTKSDIIKSASKLFKPTRPNELWETDITYIWCGKDRWCYCFNVIDVFTRHWISYFFDTTASADAAVESIVKAMATHKPHVTQLVIRSDNGTQYTSRKFKDALNVLQVNHEYIWNHTPEQNGHVESFHKTLKKEYLWPHDFTSFQEAEVVLSLAFIDYNQSRIHSSLRYVTPNEFVTSWRDRNE